MKSLHSMAKIEDYRVGRVVNGNMLFQAASISKVVCSMIALRLVQENKIKLDEDVNKYLKDWKVRDGRGNEKKVSLRQLLSHTAGISVSGFFGYSCKEKIPSLIQVLNGARPANSDKVFVKYVQGKYRYSGGGYLVVQKLIEDISRKKFEDIAKKEIFNKLGRGYSNFKFRKSNGNRLPEKAAAGLWSTASDLAKLIIEIQLSYDGKSNKILSKKMVREMLKPVVKAERGYIGLGVFLTKDKKEFFHKGHNYGFRSKILGDLDGNGYVVMVGFDSEKDMNRLVEGAGI